MAKANIADSAPKPDPENQTAVPAVRDLRCGACTVTACASAQPRLG
jgi:hypothetical protein